MRRRGFTLTEMLVAVIILSICILGILPLIAVAARAHKTSIENATALTIAKEVMAELQEELDSSSPIVKELKKSKAKTFNRKVPGISEQYRVKVDMSELSAPEDPSGSGVLAKIRIRWLPDGMLDNDANADVGRLWEFNAVLVKKLDHRDAIEVDSARAPAFSDAPTGTRPASYQPIMQWVGQTTASLPDAKLGRPAEGDTQKIVLDVMSGRMGSRSGAWQNEPLNRGTKGVAVFQTQPIKEGVDGKTIYALAGMMTYYPLTKSGIKNPRVVQLAKRDVYIDGKISDINGHGFMVVEGNPYLETQQPIAKGKGDEFADLADTGVVAWHSAGTANPWAMAQGFKLRIDWTIYTWVVAEGGQPIGYFSWRATLEGKVGAGPVDSDLKPRLQVAAFLDADGTSGQGADHILRRALGK